MDIQAVKPASSVAVSPAGRGSPAVSAAGSAKELPPAHLDPFVVQDSRDRQAAVARQLNLYLRSNSRELEFRVDAESGDAIITVRDAAGHVVRTIPGEDALEMLRRVSVDPGTFVDLMA